MQLGVPASLSSGLLSYDYYAASLVTTTTRGSLVSMAQSSLLGTLHLAGSFLEARFRKAGYELTATQTMTAAEMAAAELMLQFGGSKAFNISNDDDLIQHLNGTFGHLKKALRLSKDSGANGRRRLHQQVDLTFEDVLADATLLAKTAAQSNAAVQAQQSKVAAAVAASGGVESNVNMTDVAAALVAATRVAAAQATTLSAAAAALGNGNITADDYTTQ